MTPNLEVTATRFSPRPCEPGLRLKPGATQGWCKYVGSEGDVIGVNRFGASAPGKVMMRKYGFTVDNVYERAMKLMGRKHPG